MKTRAQTRFFLSSRTSANCPMVSSRSFSQDSSFKASWLFFIKSSLSHGFRAPASVATWWDFPSLNSSMFWLICRRTRSLYSSHAEKAIHQKKKTIFTILPIWWQLRKTESADLTVHFLTFLLRLTCRIFFLLQNFTVGDLCFLTCLLMPFPLDQVLFLRF